MTKKIALFLLFTFAITGICWGSVYFLARFGTIQFGDPLFMILFLLGGFGPTFAPFITISLTDRKPGIREYRKRLFKFGVSFWYYLFLIISLVILGLIPALINRNLDNLLSTISQTPIVLLLLFFVQSFFLGGLEELGWRGYLQHELQKQHNMGISYLVVWVLWTLWHLPLFYIPGVSQYGQNFWIFSINSLFFSLILGWVYARTRSIPMAVIGHALINLLFAIGYLTFLNSREIHWLTIGITLILLLGLHVILPVRNLQQE
jgi:uncharacterized protein